MVSNVHSNISQMSRDYVLAHYTTDVINSKFPKFIREQRKTLRIIKSFLIIPEKQLQRRYGLEEAKRIYGEIKEIYKNVEMLLLGELDEMVIISRAGHGEVTKAMLMHGRTREEREEYEDEISDHGVRDRLMEKRK